jgi:GNAT superfamily N-acetyltransferase
MTAPGNFPTDAPIMLRPMDTSDRGRVCESWVKSYSGRVCPPTQNRGLWRLVNALLDRCATLVAAFDEDPLTILGWACTSSDVVHYVHVRKEFRRQGISKQLLKPYLGRIKVFYTHAPNRAWWNHAESAKGDTYIPRVPESWIYDPFIAYEIAATVENYRSNKFDPRMLKENYSRSELTNGR